MDEHGKRVVLFQPQKARLEVRADGPKLTVEMDGSALDLLYCCAMAIKDIAKAAGNPWPAAILKVTEFLTATQVEVSGTTVSVDADTIKRAMDRQRGDGGEIYRRKPEEGTKKAPD